MLHEECLGFERAGRLRRVRPGLPIVVEGRALQPGSRAKDALIYVPIALSVRPLPHGLGGRFLVENVVNAVPSMWPIYIRRHACERWMAILRNIPRMTAIGWLISPPVSFSPPWKIQLSNHIKDGRIVPVKAENLP